MEETYFLGKKGRRYAIFRPNQCGGYYKVPIAIAENKFQEQVFTNTDTFHHISELETAMAIVPTLSSIGAKNPEERRVEYVMRVFMDAAGFRHIKLAIANIKARRVLTIPHSKDVVEDEIGLEAFAEHSSGTIYLQRQLDFGTADGVTDFIGIDSLIPYLDYNDFALDTKSIGQGDIAAFSKIRKTVSHELAHLEAHTKDDTMEHFKAILVIDSAFDKVLSEFKASSKLSTSMMGVREQAKTRLGVVDGDTVVVTYTKGSSEKMEKIERPPKSAKITPKIS